MQVKLPFDNVLDGLGGSWLADFDVILRYSKDFVLLWLTVE